uniref:Putative HD domain-containing protein n=1 Tax=viral metagenome TaxID=1070528 RepID=A0A6M3ILV5_9ZZZZ
METERNLKKFLDSTFYLLESFREKAPGTFKHCQNVANICESIAVELSLDIDTMRCSSMYHDIGKIYFPEYFSENQDDKNPHDDLDPFVSYHIITRHVSDSVMILLQVEDIPRNIIEIISQHHGNTVLQYFYEKSGSKLDDKWRYKSKQPESTESAILMIVDTVEATARSLFNAGQLSDSDSRKKVIRSTIERLVDDNQLDNMTIGVLKVVKNVLIKELDTIYHKREVYTEIDKKKIKNIKEEKGVI